MLMARKLNGAAVAEPSESVSWAVVDVARFKRNAGDVVPIPTLPEAAMRIASTPLLLKPRVFGAARYIAVEPAPTPRVGANRAPVMVLVVVRASATRLPSVLTVDAALL